MTKRIFITGGLGNQMFQYALLLAMRQKGIRVKMNTSLYQFNRMHNGYMLNTSFGIKDITEGRYTKTDILWARIVRGNRIPGLLFQEDETRFCHDVFDTCKPYINGCWINEKYFHETNLDVRNSFIFKNIDESNNAIANQIMSCNSVSLHIRRGDYLSNPMYNVCGETYYRKAIEYISHIVDNPNFYVFSDDPSWCQSYLKQMKADFTIVDCNKGRDSFKDMYLMTQCRHNIIANSTFSWWGAWLNRNNDKIVVCPNLWINGRSFNPCLSEWYHIK